MHTERSGRPGAGIPAIFLSHIDSGCFILAAGAVAWPKTPQTTFIPPRCSWCAPVKRHVAVSRTGPDMALHRRVFFGRKRGAEGGVASLPTDAVA